MPDELPEEVSEQDAMEADMVILIKNGHAFVLKDREEKGGEMGIGSLVTRLLEERGRWPKPL